MTALLALDTHPFAPDPGTDPRTGWSEQLRSVDDTADPAVCHSMSIVEIDRNPDEFIDIVADLTRRSGSLLVLYPRHRRARAEALLRTLRQLNPAPIAGSPTALPPLSAAVLALLLRRLSCRPGWDAGRLAAAVPPLEQRITSVGWVRSLSRPLRDRATTSRRPPGSWLSFNGFEIRIAPDGLQITPHRGDPVPVPAGHLAFTVGDAGRLTSGSTSAGEPVIRPAAGSPRLARPRWQS